MVNDVYVVPAHRAGTGWIEAWVLEGCLRTGQTCGLTWDLPGPGGPNIAAGTVRRGLRHGGGAGKGVLYTFSKSK